MIQVARQNAAAKKIQRAYRRSKARKATTHTRRRAPLRTLSAYVFSPMRVKRMGGNTWLEQV